MSKNRLAAAKSPKCLCDNLWKSIVMALEKPGKLGEFFSYFVATLSHLNGAYKNRWPVEHWTSKSRQAGAALFSLPDG